MPRIKELTVYIKEWKKIRRKMELLELAADKQAFFIKKMLSPGCTIDGVSHIREHLIDGNRLFGTKYWRKVKKEVCDPDKVKRLVLEMPILERKGLISWTIRSYIRRVNVKVGRGRVKVEL